MKRAGNLTRRTPMKRGTKPMPRVSPSKRKEQAATGVPRKALLESTLGQCMKCGRTSRLEVHEIARGAARHKAVHLPRLQLVLCRKCHDAVGDLEDYPVESQLAIRLVWEIEQSRRELNEARGRADTAVTSQELFWQIDFVANP